MKRLLILACLACLAGRLSANEVVQLDLAKAQEPISPYVYGQFIEHLGRCIYGGIWAEMLEDRKFYYPVTDKYDPWGVGTDKQWNAGEFPFLKASPWRVIGAPGTVTMDTNRPYAGAHAVAVRLPGDGQPAGISQEGLALEAGKKYTGRVILAGDAEAVPVVVRLVYPDGRALEHTIRKLAPDYQTYPFSLTARAAEDNAKLEVVGKGKGGLHIGTLSLMPANNVKGFRPEVLALLRELNSPIYRWPGGNFVSGYQWKDGIGPRDQRPPRKNPAWKGVEANDVGAHEFMDLLGLIKAEPYVAVNTGLGNAEDVAAEVEYFNGGANTPMGQLRAANGHPAPYGVKWWAVGNEMYGDWQLGHMPLSQYVQKHNRIAEAMKKVDPSIHLVAVGAVGDWSKTMLSNCAGHMNLLSEHIYCQKKTNLVAHTSQLAEEIRRVAAAHREYRKTIPGLAAQDIRLAMDEWNYWYGDYVYGELGTRYHLKDGLGVARGLHEYYRNSDLYFMANYAQTVNVIGCIKTTRTAAEFETTGLALKLYREHFGFVPIATTGSTGAVDVAAAWTANKKAITVGIVNSTGKPEQVALDAGGKVFKTRATRWCIAHTDPEVYNTPGEKPKVVIKEDSARVINNTLVAPPYSIVVYRLGVK